MSTIPEIFEALLEPFRQLFSARVWHYTQVFTSILNQVYQTGRKVSEEFKQTMKIVFDGYLPQWNYTAKPQMG